MTLSLFFKKGEAGLHLLVVICTRFELVTSCLSSKRSKPTELTDRLFFSRKAVAKVRTFFYLRKNILQKKLNSLILNNRFSLRGALSLFFIPRTRGQNHGKSTTKWTTHDQQFNYALIHNTLKRLV